LNIKGFFIGLISGFPRVYPAATALF